MDCFAKSLDDYTTDRRGDIGAWVREAAMSGFYDITIHLATSQSNLLPKDTMVEMSTRLAQQASEKIDRTRGLAARLFAQIIFNETIPHVPDREKIRQFFPEKLNFKTFQWMAEVDTFPIFAKLLNLDTYRERVLLGFIVSVGGLTERLVKFSSSSLFYELKSMER